MSWNIVMHFDSCDIWLIPNLNTSENVMTADWGSAACATYQTIEMFVVCYKILYVIC